MENKAKRILFLGGNLVAVECLKLLLAEKAFDVVGVLPRWGDRGAVVDPEAFNFSLRMFAAKKQLCVFNYRSPNQPEFLKIAKDLMPDYIISIQYDRILKEEIIAVPKIGCLNLHFAPLPKYRGCMPIPWAIIDNSLYGVTLHWIDPGVDTGNIIGKVEYPVTQKDTAFSLYKKVSKEGLSLFRRYIPQIKDASLPAIPQKDSESIYHPLGLPFDRWICWQWPSEKIDALIRAFTFLPFPSARTIYNGKETEIIHPVQILEDSGDSQNGSILEAGDKYVDIKTGNGRIRAKKIKFTKDSCLITKGFKTFFEPGGRFQNKDRKDSHA